MFINLPEYLPKPNNDTGEEIISQSVKIGSPYVYVCAHIAGASSKAEAVELSVFLKRFDVRSHIVSVSKTKNLIDKVLIEVINEHVQALDKNWNAILVTYPYIQKQLVSYKKCKVRKHKLIN